MAAAGHQAEEALARHHRKGQATSWSWRAPIPTAKERRLLLHRRQDGLERLKEAAARRPWPSSASGTCSSYGGIPAALPNPTGAVGVSEIIPDKPIINLPGCPVNAVNLTATIVHYLTFGALPATGQPWPAAVRLRQAHPRQLRAPGALRAGQYVEAWGDDGHRQGWCLYKMGCKGPSTFHNCPTVRWNDGPVGRSGAGHGCVGCSEPAFWDTMGPFYERVPERAGLRGGYHGRQGRRWASWRRPPPASPPTASLKTLQLQRGETDDE